jgi:methionine-rich copper-binding protein CopC
LRHFLLIIGLIALTLCFLTGCGDDGGVGNGGSPPTIILTSPADGATDVSLNTTVSVSFSEPMDRSSLDSIYVVGAPSHDTEYDDAENKVTIHLENILEAGTTYRVRITSDVMDEDGDRVAGGSEFSFTTGPLDCDHLDDAFEPNHDVGSAVQVELDREYRMLKSCGAEERRDYFAFTLTDTAKVTAISYLSYADTSRVSWNIYWLNAQDDDYSTLGTSFRDDKLQCSYHYTFLPGTYYVMMGKSYIDHHFVVYHFRLETSSPCEEDPYEDNDFIEDAAPITPGLWEGLRGCHVDADYYTLDLTAGQTLTVTASEVTSFGGTRRMKIYSPGYYERTRHTSQDEPAVESWTATEDGPHYFMIQYWVDGVVYDLDIEVTGP